MSKIGLAMTAEKTELCLLARTEKTRVLNLHAGVLPGLLPGWGWVSLGHFCYKNMFERPRIRTK